MTSPNLRRVQSDATRRRQFERDMMFDGMQFAGDRMAHVSVRLSKIVVLVCLPAAVVLRVAVWAGWL